MEDQALLEVRGVSVTYRRHRTVTTALRDVSLTVRAGQAAGLVGESGSGKSTLAKAILGISPIEAGSIWFDGREITHANRLARRRLYEQVQMVFQDPYSSLNPDLTVGASLAEPLRSYRSHSRSEVETLIGDMLERVHLPRDASRRLPTQFSGGQRQRIAIARALMLSPRLLICDEPVSALDLSVQAQILNLLRELQDNSDLALLLISHDLDVVKYVCDRVSVLYRGRVMEAGEAAQVVENPHHPYTHLLRSSLPTLVPAVQRARHAALLTPRSQDAPSDSPSTPQCVFAPRCPYAQERCWRVPVPCHSSAPESVVYCHRYPEWRNDARRIEVIPTPPRPIAAAQPATAHNAASGESNRSS